MSEINAKKRLLWARTFQHESDEYWKNILWSDESMTRAIDPGKIKVRRHQADKWDPRYFVRTVKYGKYSALVFSCVSYDHKGPLFIFELKQKVKTDVYLNAVEKCALPLLKQNTNLRYQQDNCPIHKSKIAKEWFKNNNIKLHTHVP